MLIFNRDWRNTDRLVIKDTSYKVALALLLTALFIFIFGRDQAPNIGFALIGPSFLTLMAWIAFYKVSTTFNHQTGQVEYKFERLFRQKIKLRPLSDIEHIGLRLPPAAKGEQRWLVQLTFKDQDAFWLSPSGTMDKAHLEEIVQTIKTFLALDSPEPAQDQVLVDMIKAGNKIGAIKWLRATEGLSLSEAKQKVDVLDK